MKALPPRLHIIAARQARVAVVLRRGPSRRACTMLWNLKTDAFSLGQWLNARIYERRCDLSPDGKHLIYFALNGRWSSETRGSWTAISRAPYLKAITLYAKGDAWNGGGLFLDDRAYLLNEKYPTHDLIDDRSRLTAVRGLPPPAPYGNNECLGVYYPRLLRDGWTLDETLSTKELQVFDRPWKRDLQLRKFCHRGVGRGPGKAVYFDTHALVWRGETILDCPGWEWADVLGGRLCWAQEGRLSALRTRKPFDPAKPLEAAEVLHDFNGMEFEALAAPY